MTKLAEKHCVPCRGGAQPLKGAELFCTPNNCRLENNRGTSCCQYFCFPILKPGWISWTALARPRSRKATIRTWARPGKVDVQIYTHKARGLTESDFVLAAKIDQVYFAGLR